MTTLQQCAWYVDPDHLPRLAQHPKFCLGHGYSGLPGTTTEVQDPQNRSYVLMYNV